MHLLRPQKPYLIARGCSHATGEFTNAYLPLFNPPNGLHINLSCNLIHVAQVSDSCSSSREKLKVVLLWDFPNFHSERVQRLVNVLPFINLYKTTNV